MAEKELSSAGHKLGQLVGDWFEEHFVLPLLQKVADHLKLYLDHRFRKRKARTSDKIIWRDEDNNEVDYDFVMELDGTDGKRGIPVAFLECFWRRRGPALERQGPRRQRQADAHAGRSPDRTLPRDRRRRGFHGPGQGPRADPEDRSLLRAEGENRFRL